MFLTKTRVELEVVGVCFPRAKISSSTSSLVLRNWPKIDDARISVVTDGKFFVSSLIFVLHEDQVPVFWDLATWVSMEWAFRLESYLYMSLVLGNPSVSFPNEILTCTQNSTSIYYSHLSRSWNEQPAIS